MIPACIIYSPGLPDCSIMLTKVSVRLRPVFVGMGQSTAEAVTSAMAGYTG